MGDRSEDIFGPVKEDNQDEDIEEEEDAEEEEPEEGQVEEDSSSSEEEAKADKDELDPWSPLRENFAEDLKHLSEGSPEVPGSGKIPKLCRKCFFQCLVPVSRRRLRRTYLGRLKWTRRIKHDAIYRKLMKAIRCVIKEDDTDFDEAAVAKHSRPWKNRNSCKTG